MTRTTPLSRFLFGALFVVCVWLLFHRGWAPRPASAPQFRSFEPVRGSTGELFASSNPPVATKQTSLSQPQWPDARPASKLPRCKTDNREAVMSGTSLIVGANIGSVGNDPSWRDLVRSAHRKVFVEPIPILYAKLKRNVRASNMSNYVLLNAAIDVGSNSGELVMYCIGNPGEAHHGRPHWFSQVCSTVRSRLFHQYDIARNANLQQIERQIINFTVPMLDFAQMLELARVSLESVSYLQVDVEGIDDKVILSLPLDNPAFNPRDIVWEWVLFNDSTTAHVNGFLEMHGYILCAFGPQNVLARRATTPIRANAKGKVKIDMDSFVS